MPPGGKRVGRPRVAYPQRRDLNSGDRTYGDGVNKETVVAATPGSPNTPDTPEPQPQGGPLPGQLVPLSAPSERPDEPVTAGLSVGPGPGPDTMVRPGDDDLFALRALARRFPSRDLLRLVAFAESRQ